MPCWAIDIPRSPIASPTPKPTPPPDRATYPPATVIKPPIMSLAELVIAILGLNNHYNRRHLALISPAIPKTKRPGIVPLLLPTSFN